MARNWFRKSVFYKMDLTNLHSIMYNILMKETEVFFLVS